MFCYICMIYEYNLSTRPLRNHFLLDHIFQISVIVLRANYIKKTS